MNNYFFNIRYQPNYNVAKCLQMEKDARKAVYKFEMKPLKNKAEIREIVEKKIDPKFEEIKKMRDSNIGMNWYVFLGCICINHLIRIYRKKANISDMDRPFAHLTNTFFAGTLYACLITNLTGINFRSRIEQQVCESNLKGLKTKINERYLASYEADKN